MEENYQFFMKSDLSNYIGEWVAICKSRIVSHGKDVKKVFKEAKEKCHQERALITRIPNEETMIF
ncbi:MAG: hypothetical protein A2048_10455 [Deltaproteobacteria bacterium GWA2_45_12]|nr:MAG: hypothetical protein A2048_10455 [Deltaproteobacteria bacterium GWA2_45_12]